MKTHLMFLSVAFSLSPLAFAKGGAQAEAPTPVDPPAVKNRVQVALLLDTSSSMDGLIDQAKTQLWKVVNTFTEARRHGEPPQVEVALYEYGNQNLSVETQWIRQVQPLTRDLDSLSKS